MIDVRMTEFLKTGRYGPVELGLSSERVGELLGPPDSAGGSSSRHRRPILWKYGSVEFHFHPRQGRDDRLVLIFMEFMENLEVPNGGSHVRLDAGFVRGGLPLEDVEKEFRLADWTFRRTQPPHLPGMTNLVVEGGASLLFDPEGLRSISSSGDE